MSDRTEPSPFRIFRASEAPDLMTEKCMTVEPPGPVATAAMDRLREAGYLDGSDIRVLVNIPGFSLTHVWFKAGYPLPLHSHDVDCLYYIIAGSLRLGTEELGPRDSFFIPASVPYTYKPGPDGVELLEIRQANAFNFVNMAKGKAFWDRAVEQTLAQRDAWKTAERPKLNA